MATDLTAWKLHGPVRTLRTELAEWDASSSTWRAPRNGSALVFRRDGQISEREFHNSNGSITYCTRLYDDGGRVIEERTRTDDSPATRVLYSYDQQGRLAGAVHVAHDGTRRQLEAFTYDGGGRKTKVMFLGPGSHHVRIDDSGGDSADIAYGAPGATTLSITYDERELPSEASFHDATGGVIRRIVLSRDRDGRVLTEVMHLTGQNPFQHRPPADNVPFREAALLRTVFADQVLMTVAYAYDARGRLVEWTVRMGNLSEERRTFQYDDFDNSTAETWESRQREMDMDDAGVVQATKQETIVDHRRFEYVYDAHGNWVERVGWSRTGAEPDFRASNIERRTIAYYERDPTNDA